MPAQPPTTDSGGSLARDVRTVSGLTLISRVAGLARDILLVRVFGDTAVGSAFNAAFAIPNLFRRLFGEGALSAAMIPVYTRLVRDDPPRAHQLASFVLFVLTLVTGVVTLVLELGLLLVLLFSPGTPERTLTLQLTMLLLPFMPLICVTAILGGVLQVHGRFGMPAAAPLVLNGCMIAAGVIALTTPSVGASLGAYLIGSAAVASGAVQVVWALWALRGNVLWTRVCAGARGPMRQLARSFVPVAIGLGVLQVNTLLDVIIASWPVAIGPTIMGRAVPLDEASLSILGFTQRLYQFPLGVFGIAVATVVFPSLSRAPDDESFASTLARGVRLSLFIGLPASLGLLLVRDDLVRVLFSGGSKGFSAEGVARAAAVLMGYAPAVWAYSLNQVFTRAFYARGRQDIPVKVSLAAIALNLVLNLTLIWWLREAGLAWSTAISACAQCVALAIILKRSACGHAEGRTGGGVRILVITLGMGLVVFALGAAIPDSETWTRSLFRLSAMAVGGVASYAALAAALRAPELRWLLSKH